MASRCFPHRIPPLTAKLPDHPNRGRRRPGWRRSSGSPLGVLPGRDVSFQAPRSFRWPSRRARTGSAFRPPARAGPGGGHQQLRRDLRQRGLARGRGAAVNPRVLRLAGAARWSSSPRRAGCWTASSRRRSGAARWPSRAGTVTPSSTVETRQEAPVALQWKRWEPGQGAGAGHHWAENLRAVWTVFRHACCKQELQDVLVLGQQILI